MTRNELALAYARCTDAEMRTFIQDRNLDITWTTRIGAIRSLRKADHDATFTFLDLPPEMRNMIYVQLLTLREKGTTPLRKYCWPEILSTCQQVYDEAHKILSVNQEVTVSLVLNRRYNGPPYLDHDHGVHASVNGCILHDPVDSLEWPKFLRNLTSLKLLIILALPCAMDSRAQIHSRTERLNRALYGLYHLLVGGNNNINNLDVHIAQNLSIDTNRISDMLSPLCAIGARIATTNFAFQDVSQEVAINIQNSTNILRQLLFGYEEAKLHRDLDHMLSKNDRRPKNLKRLEDVVTLMRHVGGFYTVPIERELQKALPLFEKELHRMRFRDYEQALREWASR